MLTLNQLVGFGGKPASGITLSFTASAVDPAGGLSTYTFSGVAIGAAAANRQVVVGAIGGDPGIGRTVTSITVGGTGLTKIIEFVNTGGQQQTVSLWAGAIPTGATADIVVTWAGGTQDFTGIGVWAMYGAAVGANATASSEANPASASVAIPAGGVCVGVSSKRAGGGSGTATWTQLIEQYDEVVDAPQNASHSGAHATNLGGTTPTVTCTWSVLAADNMVLASWAPG